MASINLLPSEQKRAKQTKLKEKMGFQPSAEQPFKPGPAFRIFASVSCINLLSWAAMFIQVKFKERLLDSFSAKLNIQEGKLRKIGELTEKKQDLSQTISFYRKISDSRIAWTGKLFSIMNLTPPQIWLQGIYTAEVKLDKVLTIKGYSYSPIETEILSSISQFTSTLKESAPLNENFQDFKLGELNAEKKGNLTVMGFSLSAKSRAILKQ